MNPTSKLTGSPTPTRREDTASPGRYQLSLLGVIRSEIVKLRSVNSTWVCLALAVIIHLGLTLSLAHVLWNHGLTGDGEGLNISLLDALKDPHLAGIPSIGWTYASIVIIALASLYGASEYTCSTAYSTYQAAPRRGLVLLAKAINITVVVGIFALILQAVAIFAVNLTIGGSVGDLFGSGAQWLWLTCVTTAIGVSMLALVTMLFATAARSTVAPISLMVVLIYIASPLIQAFTRSYPWIDKVQGWMLDRVQWALTIPFAPSGSQAGISSGEGMSAGTQALTGWWLVLATVLWIVVPFALTVVIQEKRDVI